MARVSRDVLTVVVALALAHCGSASSSPTTPTSSIPPASHPAADKWPDASRLLAWRDLRAHELGHATINAQRPPFWTAPIH